MMTFGVHFGADKIKRQLRYIPDFVFDNIRIYARLPNHGYIHVPKNSCVRYRKFFIKGLLRLYQFCSLRRRSRSSISTFKCYVRRKTCRYMMTSQVLHDDTACVTQIVPPRNPILASRLAHTGLRC